MGVERILPVILAGGTGSRLWPLSRTLYPKQLLSLTGNCSLLQTTLKRVARLVPIFPPLIVVGEEHRFVAKNQIEELNLFAGYTLLLEPLDKDTAAAVCGAVEYACANGYRESVILVLPTDHLIEKEEAFRAAVARAVELAVQGEIVTFGIKPEGPETGFGYIEAGPGGRVVSFTEKPEASLAEEYVRSGNYLWNSGMLAFTTRTFQQEMAIHAPEIEQAMAGAVLAGMRDSVFFRLDSEKMSAAPSQSIDYALMEKTNRAVVVAADLGWYDIGSWHGLWQVLDKDGDGNVCLGDVVVEESKNCLVHSGSRLVTAVGLEETLIVETEDAILVAPLSKAQEVRNLVATLQEKGRKEVSCHHTVHRPWGSYRTLEERRRYQIKKILLLPGAALSLQKHFHRHEHWIIISGTARVTRGNEVFFVGENESISIPEGSLHRLENSGGGVLELIEVQIGSYIGEDDILRFNEGSGDL